MLPVMVTMTVVMATVVSPPVVPELSVALMV